ncbi:MAG: serine/threonine-protein phosphatase [Microbacteriaceae bacterium]|jgi:serine/threonine protein phosphatase PrpC|nr:serine/threonine-protein phosphatase [Microbacteriaceae bacterium]
MTEIGRNAAERVLSLPGRPGVGVVLAWGASTDIGHRRAHNEDSLIAESPMFAIADGMGGHSAGDVASAAVVARLAEAVVADYTDVDAIERALSLATGDIGQAADEKALGVGTTVTGAALTVVDGDPYWAVFNVGDSRVYAFEQNELRQLTTDHSVVQELVAAGLIRREDAESHPESNVITRAVGFNAEPRTDFWSVPALKGLRLLLCSDGLTREVDDSHIRLLLAAGLSPLATAEALVDAALAGGGRDNVSTIVVDVVESSGLLDIEDTAPRPMHPHRPKKG